MTPKKEDPIDTNVRSTISEWDEIATSLGFRVIHREPIAQTDFDETVYMWRDDGVMFQYEIYNTRVYSARLYFNMHQKESGYISWPKELSVTNLASRNICGEAVFFAEIRRILSTISNNGTFVCPWIKCPKLSLWNRVSKSLIIEEKKGSPEGIEVSVKELNLMIAQKFPADILQLMNISSYATPATTR